MPVYEYSAISAQGKGLKGSLDAENLRAARQKLRSQGIYPTTIQESMVREPAKSRDLKKYFQFNYISTKDLMVMTRQFSTLVGAGLPLVSALAAMTDQTESSNLKGILVGVREQVAEGSSLAKAMANYPSAFPALYVNLIASGEASGTLDRVLENLANYLEAQVELRRRIVAALTYPIIMLMICSLVIIGMVVFVVPRIVEMFQKQRIALPALTQAILAISKFLAGYWYILLLVLALLVFGFITYYKNEKGRTNIDRLLLKLPIFGPIYIKIATARISQTLGTLLKSGVELLTCLDIAKNMVKNVHFVRALEKAKEGVREGRSLASELSKSGVFPALLSHMVAVGEKSGDLEKMLDKAGSAYEKEVNATLSGLTSLLEPLMLVVVGGIVLLIVISVLLPMADMIGQVR